jgi:hypothetical protein
VAGAIPGAIAGGLWSLLWVLFLGVPYATPYARRAARDAAWQRFKSHRVGTDDDAGFDGATAQVLKTEETFNVRNGRVRDHFLTVFAVTPAGRYYLFKTSKAQHPYLQQLPTERARLVLKKRFRAFVPR